MELSLEVLVVAVLAPLAFSTIRIVTMSPMREARLSEYSRASSPWSFQSEPDVVCESTGTAPASMGEGVWVTVGLTQEQPLKNMISVTKRIAVFPMGNAGFLNSFMIMALPGRFDCPPLAPIGPFS